MGRGGGGVLRLPRHPRRRLLRRVRVGPRPQGHSPPAGAGAGESGGVGEKECVPGLVVYPIQDGCGGCYEYIKFAFRAATFRGCLRAREHLQQDMISACWAGRYLD